MHDTILISRNFQTIYNFLVLKMCLDTLEVFFFLFVIVPIMLDQKFIICLTKELDTHRELFNTDRPDNQKGKTETNTVLITTIMHL